MKRYRAMYLHLFNAVTDALRLLQRGEPRAAAFLLQRAQQHCEMLYMEQDEEPPEE